MLDGARVIRRVLRGDIEKLELRYGFRSRHPALQAVLGGAVSCLGIPAVKVLLDWFRFGGVMVDRIALLALLVPAGLWLVYDALQRGFVLVVQGNTSRLRIPLEGRPAGADVARVVEESRSKLGYEIVDVT
ncbi:MAG: hypothetical protein L0216_05915 [Planctomycetales bacterium]|nr:hypothetical protein [Planctomycetales bacterium]